jgi:hypothetical protein
MSVPIVTRKQWGAKPWRSTIYRVPMSEKDNFLVHYHGGRVRDQWRGGAPQHRGPSTSPTAGPASGTTSLVDLDGTVYEGRGWDGVGSQCPGFNRSAWACTSPSVAIRCPLRRLCGACVRCVTSS